MKRQATAEEVAAIEDKLHGLGMETGKMVGAEITLIGAYGDVTKIPEDEIARMAGVDEIIRISRAYKRAAQKGSGRNLIRSRFPIGSVSVGGDRLVIVAGPCSVESEAQIMEAARTAAEAGADCLRGGVIKYRSSPYSGWEGLGGSGVDALKNALRLLVKAGREHGLPTVAEILDHTHLSLYEDYGIDCLQVGEPNAKNQALLNALRATQLPIIHKRGNSLDMEAYLLWVERVMAEGKENVILCERGITSCNRYTRNTLDCAAIAAFRYQLSCLPIAVDASHGTGIRDLVHPLNLAGVVAGADVILVEAHPNPLIAKSDGFQGLFPEQLQTLVKAARRTKDLMREIESLWIPSSELEQRYEGRIAADKARFFGEA